MSLSAVRSTLDFVSRRHMNWVKKQLLPVETAEFGSFVAYLEKEQECRHDLPSLLIQSSSNHLTASTSCLHLEVIAVHVGSGRRTVSPEHFQCRWCSGWAKPHCSGKSHPDQNHWHVSHSCFHYSVLRFFIKFQLLTTSLRVPAASWEPEQV